MTNMVSQNGISYPVRHTPSPAELAAKRLASSLPKMMVKLIGGI